MLTLLGTAPFVVLKTAGGHVDGEGEQGPWMKPE